MVFQTEYRYTDRKTKARYFGLKHQAILKEKFLDVGAYSGRSRTPIPIDREHYSD